MSVASPAAATALGPVVDRFRNELDQVESIFYAAGRLSTVDQYQVIYAPAEDGCLVSLWDAWNRFMRDLLLTSASGAVQGLSGTIYTPSVARTPTVAVAHIVSNSKGTLIKSVRGEPQWYSVTAASDFVRLLALSNAAAIVAAVTASSIQFGAFSIPNPLEEIRRCRNFVAHKCEVTLGDVLAYAPAGLTNLQDHVHARRYGVDLFSDWKEGCLAIAEAAAQ
jgi:hypothetical protein